VTSSELQEYLHDHIPLSRAMQVAVVLVEEDSVVLSAPLRPTSITEKPYLEEAPQRWQSSPRGPCFTHASGASAWSAVSSFSATP
jgi:hypothetical protein